MASKSARSPFVFTGLAALRFIGIGGLVAAAVFWWPVQSELTSNRVVAAAYTAGLVLAPPALWSFIFPWSPGGMLLLRIQARTIGLYIVGAAALFFLYYSVQLQSAWWAAQPAAAESGMIGQQVGVGLLLYIVIPGLVWTPISSDELYTQVNQDQLVQRYAMQTKADIAILDTQLLRQQQLAAVGMANLMASEREELADALDGLISGMDMTLQRIAGNFNQAAETVYGARGRNLFSAPPFADDFRDILSYVSQAIGGSRMQLAAPTDDPDRHAAALRADLQDSRDRRAWRQVGGDERTFTAAADAPPRPAALRRAPPRYAAEYDSALEGLREPFSASDLARHLGKSERTARDVIKAWLDERLVTPGDIKNSYFFLSEGGIES